MKNLWDTEPVLILGAVQAAIALAVAFGIDLTSEQTATIVAFSAAVLSVVARRKVTPE